VVRRHRRRAGHSRLEPPARHDRDIRRHANAAADVLHRSLLSRTHELDFNLSTGPNTQWGTGSADAPPSFGAGPVTFPASTRAALDVTPGQIRIAPGSSTTVTVAEDNSLGTSGPTTIAYTATAPSGLTAGPATATLTADAGKTASTTATITAASGTATGYYQVEFAAHASNGATLPDVSLLVTRSDSARTGRRPGPSTRT